ncbi:MAG: DUF1501 domain-containing protein [Planctomycetales bacterium]
MAKPSRGAFCGSLEHGVSRRTFLGGVASGAAAIATDVSGVHAFASGQVNQDLKRQDKRVILLWLAGGASQLETWDPKPGRPTGGPFRAIATDVAGVHISELMPKTAQRFGKSTAVIRSLNTKNGSHGGGAMLMMRGRNDEPNIKYPDMGAMASRELGRADSKVPDYVAVYSQTEGRGGGKLTPGFLGSRHAAIQLTDKMTPPDLHRLEDVSELDHGERADLRHLLGKRFTRGRELATLNSHATAYQRVQGLMASDQLFDVSREPEKIRERYGPTQFGQQVLMARRLAEAGVPFVRISRAWWDSHGQNFETHLELVTELDHVLSTLLEDLHERGMLENTLVVTLAEFGRTPKINASLGRDHFANAWSASLSGCGVVPGSVYGKTDQDGNTVAEGEIGAGELMATIFNAVGVDHEKEYYLGSRPIPLVNPGIHPVKDVLS